MRLTDLDGPYLVVTTGVMGMLIEGTASTLEEGLDYFAEVFTLYASEDLSGGCAMVGWRDRLASRPKRGVLVTTGKARLASLAADIAAEAAASEVPVTIPNWNA